MRIFSRGRVGAVALSAALGAVVSLTSLPVAAQASGAASDAMVKQVTRQVLRELRDSGALRKAVREGIQDFIRAQREAQAEARRARADAAKQAAQGVRRVSPDRDHIFGNPDAKVSLIEYSDFECPFCKRFHPTARALVQRYKGKVNWVYRHFPLAFHNPGAQTEAEASECATKLGGNKAFWRFADAIYARTRSNGKGFPRERLAPLAEEIGLDKQDFNVCMASRKMAARVREDYEEGQRIGISGTPGNVLLNNVTGEVVLRAGAVPIRVLATDVDQLLHEKP